MIIYHGSTVLVEKPEIRISDSFLDFGTGFYTTTSEHQAERWAKIKMRRESKNIGYVSIYEFDFELAQKQAEIYHFTQADMEWLQFVVRNRRGETPEKMFDMHIGPVADDNVYRSIRLFETGVLDAEETVKRLKTEVLQDQWTFHTETLSIQKKSERRNNDMGQEQFAAIMPYISADLVGMIAKKKNISENDAITKLYNSKLYATLEQEDTKVWQYSTDMLYLLFEQEEKTGKIEFPDV